MLLPALSKKVREGYDVKFSFLLGVEYITAIVWPSFLVIVILAHPLVFILLGHQWIIAVPLVQIVAASYLFSFPATLPNPTLIAVGAVRDTVVMAMLTVPVTIGIQLGASFLGVRAVAWSLFAVGAYTGLISLVMIRRRVSFGWTELGSAVKKSAIVALGSAIGPGAIALMAGGASEISIAQSVVAGIMAGAGWLLAVKYTRHPLLSEIVRAVDAVSIAVTSGLADVRSRASIRSSR